MARGIAVEDRRSISSSSAISATRSSTSLRGSRARFSAKPILSRDRQRRIERVALERHRDVASRRRQRVDPPSGERIAPSVTLLEARDHAQRRGLAASRGAQQRHDLAVPHVQIERCTARTPPCRGRRRSCRLRSRWQAHAGTAHGRRRRGAIRRAARRRRTAMRAPRSAPTNDGAARPRGAASVGAVASSSSPVGRAQQQHRLARSAA